MHAVRLLIRPKLLGRERLLGQVFVGSFDRYQLALMVSGLSGPELLDEIASGAHRSGQPVL